MRCERVREKLVSLLKGELAEPILSEVKQHLAGCAVCSAAQEEFSKTDDLLGRWKPGGGSPDLWPAIEARLDSPRIVRPRYWIPVGAAALLAVAVGLAWLIPGGTGPITPPVGPPRMVHEDDLMQRHVLLTSWKGGQVPVAAYPYRGGYDEALDEGTYISYSSKLSEGHDGPQSGAENALPILPRYLPAGSVLRSSDSLNPGVQSVYWTPLGELSIFETRECTGRAGIQTVIQHGREFKIARFVVKDIEVTLMSEGLPWPELDLIRKGLSDGPF